MNIFIQAKSIGLKDQRNARLVQKKNNFDNKVNFTLSVIVQKNALNARENLYINLTLLHDDLSQPVDMGLKDKGPKEMLGLVQEKATLVSMIFTFRVIIQKRSQMRAKMNIYLFWRAQNWNYLKNGTLKLLQILCKYFFFKPNPLENYTIGRLRFFLESGYSIKHDNLKKGLVLRQNSSSTHLSFARFFRPKNLNIFLNKSRIFGLFLHFYIS